MKAFFYSFMSVSYAFLVVGLREKDFPIFQKPSGAWCEWMVHVFDWYLIIASIVLLPVYYISSKDFASSLFMWVTMPGAVAAVWRIYKNLGPSRKMFFLGAVANLSVLPALQTLEDFNSTGNQYLHGSAHCSLDYTFSMPTN